MQLLCYEGDEIYFKSEPALVGKTFKDALFAYNDSCILGYMNSAGSVKLNPSMDLIITKDDKLVAISADDDKIILSGIQDFKINRALMIEKVQKTELKQERNLILGWNQKGRTILYELEKYVGKGSVVHVLSEFEISEKELNLMQLALINQTLTFEKGNITDSHTLFKTDVTSFDNIIILSYNHIDQQEADAKTLIALLHIRSFAEKNNKKVNIVSEMFDQNNRDLAAVTKANDFIISDNLISRMLTQLSETPELKKVFDDLFDADGSEIYLKNANEYVKTSVALNFYTVLESASLKKETAIGYRIVKDAHYVEKNYGIVINPVKTDLITFSDEDKIIVLAEN